jgi:hypothetical protein
VVSVARILRDYKDAGSLNELLALWGFVDDSAFLTNAGHVGLVYRVHGIDYEGLTHEQRQALVHRVEAARDRWSRTPSRDAPREWSPSGAGSRTGS